MCPGWWAGRGCLLGVLLLVAGGEPAPAAPSTTPGAPGASHHPPRLRHHSRVEATWVPRARRPPPPDSHAGLTALDRQGLPTLLDGPTDPPGITAPDPSMMARQPRSTASNITRNFSHHHMYRYQLYSENSELILKLATDGTVSFIDDQNDPHTLLQQKPRPGGVLELQSDATGLYLCMNHRGLLYASCNWSLECQFVQKLENTYYDTIRSHRYRKRYLAISKSGRIKRARQVKGHLGQEHFFIFRRLNRQKTNHIIKHYQARLGRPVQSCAGYNECRAGLGSIRKGCHRVTDIPTSTTSTTVTTTTTTTTALPTTTPVTAAPTSVTSTSPKGLRRCRVVSGKRRCWWCRIVKGKRKCRRKPKKCKSKRCKRKRKKQKQRKTSHSNRSRRIKQRRDRDRESENLSLLQSERRGRRKMVEGKSRSSERQQNQGSQKRQTPRRQRPKGKTGRTRHSHGRGQQSKTSRSPTTTTTTTTTTTPPPLLRRPQVFGGSSVVKVMQLSPSSRRPFPSAPSSARPYRVRHGHNLRRGRRPRGRRKPLPSTDA